MACPWCGATNAVSRQRCARCRAALSGDDATWDERDTASERQAAQVLEGTAAESSGLLILFTLVAGLAIVGVLSTILSARGVGPFASATEPPTPRGDEPAPVEVDRVRASSALRPLDATGPERLIDGDPATAWHEAAPGDGTGEWVQLRLSRRVRVSGLLLWNGYQEGDAYQQNNRVARLRIRIAGRRFTVRLLDQRGPQAVNLPDAVRARSLRLVIDSVYRGTRYNDATLGEVEVLALP